MLASLHNRRTRSHSRPAPALWEPLESRQLLSASPGTAAAGSGLDLSVVKSTVPAVVLTTAKLKGSVTISIDNAGANTETSANSYAVYASTDGLVDSTATELGLVPNKKLNLKAGHVARLTLPIKSQPAPQAGTYQILVQAVDDIGDVSTTGVAPSTLAVEVPAARLSAVVGTALPTAVTGGKTVKFQVTFTDSGNINATGSLTAALGLSTDGVTVPSDLTTVTHGVTVKQGKSTVVTYSLKIPTDTTPGTYYVAVTATQATTATYFTAFSTTPLTVGIA